MYDIECSSFARPWEKKIFTLYSSYPDGLEIESGHISYGRVLRDDNAVAGYIIWSIHRRSLWGRIFNIAVRADARGRGIGTTLMQYALQHMKITGMARCKLEVRESNTAARHLYESLRMRKIGRIPKYYGDEDAIVYTVDL
ncbi:MAG: GNAT family N-acetyltransferase [Candidatus Thorarchaeota archaeon]|nr:GNAT family N-acetyltransferase [Candidatus Thorarchaeota archaeon]